jgi:HK97 gp10 family phage protein
MSVTTTFKVFGLKELEKALHELGSEVAGQNGGLVRTALWAASKPVLDDAISRVPKDTHRLEKAIVRSRAREPDPALKANEVVDVGLFKRGKGKKVWWGGWVEFGTPNMAPRPFLRPALESNRDESTTIFRKKLATEIVKVAKKVGNKNAATMASRIKKFS